jgi:DNA-binding NarL/FixJ family response regulator
MVEQIKILIADDFPVVRSGLAAIIDLNPEMRVIGEATDGLEAVNKVIALKPDIVLMDVYLPRMNGLEATVAIREQAPGVKVIMLTASQRDEDLFRSLKIGAQGYILKTSTAAEVVVAIRKCAQGEMVISPELTGKLAMGFREKPSVGPALSARETEVLTLLSRGLNNTEISGRLFISESTVRTYIRRLFEKLHVRNRVEAATYDRERVPSDV